MALFVQAFLDMEQRTNSIVPFKTVDFNSICNKLNLRVNKKRKTSGASTSREESIQTEVDCDEFWDNFVIEKVPTQPKLKNKMSMNHNPQLANQGTYGPHWMTFWHEWIAWPWGWKRCIMKLKTFRRIKMTS